MFGWDFSEIACATIMLSCREQRSMEIPRRAISHIRNPRTVIQDAVVYREDLFRTMGISR
jgi:hypothetical protein